MSPRERSQLGCVRSTGLSLKPAFMDRITWSVFKSSLREDESLSRSAYTSLLMVMWPPQVTRWLSLTFISVLHNKSFGELLRWRRPCYRQTPAKEGPHILIIPIQCKTSKAVHNVPGRQKVFFEMQDPSPELYGFGKLTPRSRCGLCILVYSLSPVAFYGPCWALELNQVI